MHAIQQLYSWTWDYFCTSLSQNRLVLQESILIDLKQKTKIEVYFATDRKFHELGVIHTDVEYGKDQ